MTSEARNWVFRSWVEGLAIYHFSSGYLFEFYEWSSRKWVVSVLDFRWKMLSLEADAHCHWSRYAADMHKIPDPIFQSWIWESLMVGNINMNQGGPISQVDHIKQLQSYTFHFFYSLWQILTSGNKKMQRKSKQLSKGFWFLSLTFPVSKTEIINRSYTGWTFWRC